MAPRQILPRDPIHMTKRKSGALRRVPLEPRSSTQFEFARITSWGSERPTPPDAQKTFPRFCFSRSTPESERTGLVAVVPFVHANGSRRRTKTIEISPRRPIRRCCPENELPVSRKILIDEISLLPNHEREHLGIHRKRLTECVLVTRHALLPHIESRELLVSSVDIDQERNALRDDRTSPRKSVTLRAQSFSKA